MKVGLVLAAAGQSTRMGGIDKLLVPLGGRPALAWALDTVTAVPDFAEVVIVVNPTNVTMIQHLVANATLRIPVQFCFGGTIRAASVQAGVRQLSPAIDLVVIHDAARPLATPALFTRVIQSGAECGAAIAALPVHDTIKQVDRHGRIVATLTRQYLVAVQTPQCFRRDWLEHAYQRVPLDELEITDEAVLLERAGFPVQTVAGDPENLKLTTPVDLLTAEAVLQIRQQKGVRCSE